MKDLNKSVQNEKRFRWVLATTFFGLLSMAAMAQQPAPTGFEKKDLKLSGLCGSGKAYSQGYEITWNGVSAPSAFDAQHGGSKMICVTFNLSHQPLIKGESPEFLKRLRLDVGSCWNNIHNLSPSGENTGQMTGDLGHGTGEWHTEIKGNVIDFTFEHPSTGSKAGDGDFLSSGYRCVQYNFCFSADVNPNCKEALGLNIAATVQGDGAEKGAKSYNSLISFSALTVNTHSPEIGPSVKNLKAENPNGEMVSLEWDFSGPSAPAEFVIEHSQEGKNFTEVIRMNANDAAVGENHYHFLFPETIEGRVFYRVRLQGQDGAPILSPPAETMVSASGSFVLDYLKPNPATDYAEIAFNSDDEAFTEIQVQDMTGKIIYNENVYAFKGFNKITFTIENWKSGIYIVYLQKGQKSISTKLVRQ